MEGERRWGDDAGHHAPGGVGPWGEDRQEGHPTGGHEGHHELRAAGPSEACPCGRGERQLGDGEGHRVPREEGPSQVGLREREQGPWGGQEERHEPHGAAPQAEAQREQDP